MQGALQNQDLTVIILESVVISYALELCVRNILLFKNNDKTLGIHIGKSLLGFFFALKTAFFLSFYTNQGLTCFVTTRFADIFYQLAMAAGNFVLLSRVHAIIPLPWKVASKYSVVVLTVLRVVIGIVDMVFLRIDYDEFGKCIYVDNNYTGPIYTFFDLIIDVYVSGMITYVLVSHIRRLENANLAVNASLYVAVVAHNIIRTVMLTVFNLISAIFLIMDISNAAIMIVWPLVNLFVVLLIGYDADVTKTIVRLKEQYWTKVNSMLSSTTLGTPLVMESLAANASNNPMWKSSPDLPLRPPPSIHQSPSTAPPLSMTDQQRQYPRYPQLGYWSDDGISL